MAEHRIHVRITVTGAVQGIGYRPFAAGWAAELGLSGTVRNCGGIVILEVCGTRSRILQLEDILQRKVPSGGYVVSIKEEMLEDRSDEGTEAAGEMAEGEFRIIDSRTEQLSELPAFPPDLGICPDCEREMRDPEDRRFRYGLISCTLCGPRWSILDRFPYDRENTAMRPYSLCPSCGEEYRKGRRRHAQTISCHDCGPQMYFIKSRSTLLRNLSSEAAGERPKDRMEEGAVYGKEGFEEAVQVLKNGGILALKGVGGYQLLCRADSEESVQRLRRMKGREHKPFAVMFSSADEMKRYAWISGKERELLESSARPIVLLCRKEEETDPNSFPLLVPGVFGGSRYLGAFLPSFGVQKLLTEEAGPLVVTSANTSSEPIPFCEKDFARMRFAEGLDADGIYLHDRCIRRPLDDSVAAIPDGRIQLIRRSRGYVPMPVFLPEDDSKRTAFSKGTGDQPVILAAGGDLKAAFAIAKGRRVILSQYFGDLGDYAVNSNYLEQEAQMEQIFEAKPSCVVCDLHPAYHSTRLATEYARAKSLPLIQVQHHQAHAASVMAEWGLRSCIGIVFDGTGCGTDGQLWGGEFLYLCEGDFRRLGSLSDCRMLGGDSLSIRADLAADCCRQLVGEETKNSLVGTILSEENGKLSRTILSTSMGRLFDAAASILGLGQENHYEGECAVLLENAAWRALWKRLPSEAAASEEKAECRIDASGPVFRRLFAECLLCFRSLTRPSADGRILLSTESLISGLLEMQKKKRPTEEAALFFHLAIVYGTAQITEKLAERTGEKKICLSGGCFANRLLLTVLEQLLAKKRLTVYRNEQVPGNDGGLALGQAYLAGWRYPAEKGQNNVCGISRNGD